MAVNTQWLRESRIQKNQERILYELRQNGRVKLKEIAAKTKIPVSTVYDTLRTLEKNATVRHTTLVDFERFGYQTRVFMALKTTMGQRGALEAYLRKHANVNSVFRINTGYDFLVEAIFRNQKEAQDFIEVLQFSQDILDRHVFHVINVVGQETFVHGNLIDPPDPPS